MQNLLFIFLHTLLGFSAFSQHPQDQILGFWTNEDHTRVIEFVKNDNNYDAIIKKAEPESLIGMKQITSLKYKKANAYTDGTLHIIQKDKTVDCSVKIINNSQLELKVVYGFMSKSQVFTKM